MSSTPATRPEPIEEDEAERRALEAAVAEARADHRSAPHAEVRAWLLRLAAGEFDADALEFAIWKRDAQGVWNVCELWRMHEIMSDQQEIAFFEVCIWFNPQVFCVLTPDTELPHEGRQTRTAGHLATDARSFQHL